MCGNCDSGWFYPPLQNYQMISGNQMDSINVAMNATLAEGCLRQSLYTVPFIFGNYTQYPDTTSFIKPPSPTDVKPCVFDFSNPWGGSAWGSGSAAGWQPWGGGYQFGNTSPSSGSSNDTPEQAVTRKRINKLKNLLTQLADEKNKVLSEDDRTKTNTILSSFSREKGVDAQYKKLKDQYDELKKKYANKIKEFIPKSNLGEDSVNVMLGKAGYEMYTKPLDSDLIDATQKAIERVSADLTKVETAILDGLKSDQYDILDVLSSWNTRFYGKKVEKDKVDAGNIIKYIAGKMLPDKPENKSMNEELRDTTIAPLKSSLVAKAEEIVRSEYLSNETKDEIKKLKEKVVDDYAGNDWNNLADSYYALYAALRKAATFIVNKTVVEYYDFLDDKDIFNDKLFMDETETDLKEEGITSSITIVGNVDGNGAEEKVATSKQNNDKVDKTKPVAEQVNALVTGKELEEVASSVISSLNALLPDGKTVTKAWIDTFNTPAKVYVIIDGNLQEVSNVKIENGSAVTIDRKKGAGLKEAKAQDIRDARNEKIKADEDKAKAEKDAKAANQKLISEILEKTNNTVGNLTVYRDTVHGYEYVIKDGKFYKVKDNQLEDSPVSVQEIRKAHAKLSTKETEDAKVIRDRLRKELAIYGSTGSGFGSYKEEFALVGANGKKMGNYYSDHLQTMNNRNVLYIIKNYQGFLGRKFFYRVQSQSRWFVEGEHKDISQKAIEYVIAYAENNKEALSSTQQAALDGKLKELENLEITQDIECLDNLVDDIIEIFDSAGIL